jgi:hypothetical protein
MMSSTASFANLRMMPRLGRVILLTTDDSSISSSCTHLCHSTGRNSMQPSSIASITEEGREISSSVDSDCGGGDDDDDDDDGDGGDDDDDGGADDDDDAAAAAEDDDDGDDDDDDDDDDDGGDDDDDDGKVEGGLIVEGACCSPLRAKYWLLAFFRSTSTHSWKDGICVRVGSRHIASPIP